MNNIVKEISKKLSKRQKFNKNIDTNKNIGIQLLNYTKTYRLIFQENGSVFSNPLIRIPFENIVMPPLHTLNGILNKIRVEAEHSNPEQYVINSMQK